MQPQQLNNRIRKRRRQRQTGHPRRKWYGRMLEWAVIVLCAVLFVAARELSGGTIGDVPVGLWRYVVLTSMAAVIAWAWLKKKLKDNAFIYAVIGFVSGLVVYVLIITLYFGANYLFPQSEPYRRVAVVYDKKVEHHSRGADFYGIGLRFDDGRRFMWDGGNKVFDGIQIGDTCAVTLFKGLFGLDVVKTVNVIGRIDRDRDLFPESFFSFREKVNPSRQRQKANAPINSQLPDTAICN